MVQLYSSALSWAQLLWPLSLARADDQISLQIFSDVPDDIARPVHPSFAGFGIEPFNLFSFLGYGDGLNTLTDNLLHNLLNYTGRPPSIRIGGNTQDYFKYNDSMDQWTYINNPEPVGQGLSESDSMLVGPRFFEAANRLPAGTPVVWGLNMACQETDYLDQITNMAEHALSDCPNLNISAFEIGNEPDLYLQNGFREDTWGGREYTSEWLDRATAVWDRVLEPRGLPRNFFESACTASTIGTDFQIDDLVSFAIDSTTSADPSASGFISGWNQHDYYYYIGVSSYPVTLEHLMTFSTTEEQFLAWTEQVEQARETGHRYALREMGVVGPIGLEGVTNTFGAALWALNFLLYAASLDIASVQLHMTDNSNASAWQPIEMYDRKAFVRPIYYGIAAFDQIIGASCSAQISQSKHIMSSPSSLDSSGSQGGNVDPAIRTYSVYQSGQLQSVVIINGKMANASSDGEDFDDRPATNVTISLPNSLAGKTLHFAYLSGPGADAIEGTTWNGISFEESGDGSPTWVNKSGSRTRATLIAGDGTATILVRYSEALVGNLGGELGTTNAEQHNESACEAMASLPPPAGGSHSFGNDDNDDDENAGGTIHCAHYSCEHSEGVLVAMGIALALGLLLF